MVIPGIHDHTGNIDVPEIDHRDAAALAFAPGLLVQVQADPLGDMSSAAHEENY
jgi:hypothetical protein